MKKIIVFCFLFVFFGGSFSSVFAQEKFQDPPSEEEKTSACFISELDLNTVKTEIGGDDPKKDLEKVAQFNFTNSKNLKKVWKEAVCPDPEKFPGAYTTSVIKKNLCANQLHILLEACQQDKRELQSLETKIDDLKHFESKIKKLAGENVWKAVEKAKTKDELQKFGDWEIEKKDDKKLWEESPAVSDDSTIGVAVKKKITDETKALSEIATKHCRTLTSEDECKKEHDVNQKAYYTCSFTAPSTCAFPTSWVSGKSPADIAEKEKLENIIKRKKELKTAIEDYFTSYEKFKGFFGKKYKKEKTETLGSKDEFLFNTSKKLSEKISFLLGRFDSLKQDIILSSSGNFPVQKILTTTNSSAEGRLNIFKKRYCENPDNKPSSDTSRKMKSFIDSGEFSAENPKPASLDGKAWERWKKWKTAGCDDNLFDKGIKLVVSLLGTLAVLLLIIAAAMMITAHGDQEKITKAKKIIGLTLGGLLVAFLSFTIVQFVIDFVS